MFSQHFSSVPASAYNLEYGKMKAHVIHALPHFSPIPACSIVIDGNLKTWSIFFRFTLKIMLSAVCVCRCGKLFSNRSNSFCQNKLLRMRSCEYFIFFHRMNQNSFPDSMGICLFCVVLFCYTNVSNFNFFFNSFTQTDSHTLHPPFVVSPLFILL